MVNILLIIILGATIVGTLLFVETILVNTDNELMEWFHQVSDKNIQIFETKVSNARALMSVISELPEMQTTQHTITEGMVGIDATKESEKREILKNIIESSDLYTEVGYFLPNGELYLLEPSIQQQRFHFTNFAFRDWYAGALNTDGVYISEVFEAQPDYTKTIAFSKKIQNIDNQIVGILVGVIDFGMMGDSINNENDVEHYFIDHNYNLVFGTVNPNELPFEYYEYSDEIALAMSGKHDIITKQIDGVESFVIYQPLVIDDHTWAYLSIIDKDVFFVGDITRIQTYIFLAVFSASFLIMIYKKEHRNLLGFKRRWESIPNIEDKNFNDIKLSKPPKNTIVLMIATVALVAMIIGNVALVPEQIEFEPPRKLTSNYVIQNLKGDEVDTWIAWNVLEDDLFHVHLQDSSEVNDKLIEATIDVILSQDTVLIDDSELHKGPEGTTSTYYKGWYGGLNSINKETQWSIPQNLHFHVTGKGEGDIIIELKDYANSDGYSGYARSIVDEQNHQILKSSITIYDIDRLSLEEYKTILRHELGHGFGLGHSTAPEDLMHPTIDTNYPYISECVLDAITELYDGKGKSKVVCEK